MTVRRSLWATETCRASLQERQKKRTDLCHSWLSVFDPRGSVMTAEEGSEVNRFACKRLELDLT